MKNDVAASGKPVRQSNFELLRIFSILMIIMHHFVVHGNFVLSGAATPIVNKIWLLMLAFGGKPGVNLFILISGYFMIFSRDERVAKSMKLWLQVFTYAAGIALLFAYINGQITLYSLRYFVAPVSASDWWFIKAYFPLLLLSPFLNRALRSLDKRRFQWMLFLMIVLFSVIPSAVLFIFRVQVYIPEMLWFFVLYSVGAYIRIWHENIRMNPISVLVTATGVTFLSVLAVCFGCIVLGMDDPLAFFEKLCFQNNPLFLLAALLWFIGFKQLPIRYHKAINLPASAVFGIYLIHDHPTFRDVLWKQIFHVADYQDSPYLILFSLGVVFLVFIGCLMIELIRLLIPEKLYMQPINRLSAKIEEKISGFFTADQ